MGHLHRDAPAACEPPRLYSWSEVDCALRRRARRLQWRVWLMRMLAGNRRSHIVPHSGEADPGGGA